MTAGTDHLSAAQLMADMSDQIADLATLSDIVDADRSGLSDSFRKLGMIGILPLWQGMYRCCGLRIIPSKPPQQWPGLMISNNGFGQTISSDATQLFPMWQLHLSAANRTLWDDVKKSVELVEAGRRMHVTLGGGTTDWSDFIGAFIASDGLNVEEAGTVDFETKFANLAQLADRSPTFANYAHWMGSFQHNASDLPNVAQMGAWRCFASVRTWLNDQEAAESDADVLELLFQTVQQNCGLDTSINLPLSWASQPGRKSARATISSLSRFLASKVGDRPPALSDIVEQLVVSGVDYDGLAHSQAAAVTAESGDVETAWELICAAAWWMTNSLGETPPAIFDAAAKLCEENGWEDAAWTLDHLRI